MPMQAAERRKIEMENLRNERMCHIVECAFGLFAEKGIESISMNEIAVQAEIGVASLYRYFQTKEDLAIEAAIYAWGVEERVFSGVFSTEEYGSLSGLEQIRSLLEVFQDAVVTQRSFFSFIYYFDSFITKGDVGAEKLRRYDETVNVTNQLVINAFSKGRKDGSIHLGKSGSAFPEASDLEICFTMMHSLFCVAQKIAISGEMLQMDRAFEGRRQIEILINMMLSALG
ncbi:TetR/AcrR family transcriptional regulator [Treponema saccharophilum]|uniref:TetR/AcrR family transcriptional regulator n=1 Tax=Treponema saccharophilum TaxID=165 RepID=UPI0038652EA2